MKAWLRYQLPYAAKAYAYFPVTLTKRVLFKSWISSPDWMARRFWEKWGRVSGSLRNLNGLRRPLWFHMNSGGEAVMAEFLIRRLIQEDWPCVFSTDSIDARHLIRSWQKEDRVFFVPWDTLLPVARAVQSLRPAALIFVTNAYFPVLIGYAKRRGIRTLLINGLLSRNIRLANPFWDRAISLGVHRRLDALGVQTQADGEAFQALGVPAERLTITGKLEADLTPISLSSTERQTLRRSLGLCEEDPTMVVGSTHPAEIDTLLDAFEEIRKVFLRFRLILVPRLVWEVHRMAERVKSRGYSVTLQTQVRKHGSSLNERDILLVDTFGQLRRLYGVADIAFIGSSLIPLNERRGGHNPLEPLAHGVPTLFGPHMNLWKAEISQLLSVWPGFEVASPHGLAAQAIRILRKEAPLSEFRLLAEQMTQREAGSIDKTVTFLKGWL